MPQYRSGTLCGVDGAYSIDVYVINLVDELIRLANLLPGEINVAHWTCLNNNSIFSELDIQYSSVQLAHGQKSEMENCIVVDVLDRDMSEMDTIIFKAVNGLHSDCMKLNFSGLKYGICCKNITL